MSFCITRDINIKLNRNTKKNKVFDFEFNFMSNMYYFNENLDIYIKWYHIEYRISVNKMMRKYFQQIKTLRIEHNIFQRLVDIIISHANN